jgi:hypothetical protein
MPTRITNFLHVSQTTGTTGLTTSFGTAREHDLAAFRPSFAQNTFWVGILDTVGVTIAGAAEDATRILLGVSGSSSGPSLVFGHARRIGALDAALVNGTASHALDFDDCNNTLGGHPSVPILPALFALADSAFAFATNAGGLLSVAVDCSISYPVASRPGDVLRAVAVEQSTTNRLAFCEVTVFNQHDVAVGYFRGTVYRTARPHVLGEHFG